MVQNSIEGKKKRSQAKYTKYNDAQKTQLDSYKEGMFYEAGVAVTLAKRTLKTVAQNPKGTPNDQLKCAYYHQLCCTTLGHKACSSPLCSMKRKSKEERSVALKVILTEQVDLEVKNNAVLLGLYFCHSVLLLYTYLIPTYVYFDYYVCLLISLMKF